MRQRGDHVQTLVPWTTPEWDKWVVSRPDTNFFHLSAWVKTLADTYGYRPHYLAIGETGKWQAVLPLMEVKSWLTGRRAVALPFTDECPPIGDVIQTEELFQAAIKQGKTLGWKYLEFRGGRQKFAKATASLAFYVHQLDLSPGEGKLFEKMDATMRRGIRKAEKEGVTIDVSQTLESMKLFYQLQCQTRKRHGLPPQPFVFFLNIYRNILSQNLGIICVARHGGQAIAAAVYFFAAGKAIYKFGASDYTSQQLRPNNLVMWSAIKWLVAKGSHTLHFGRTSLAHDGLRRFKLAWGAQETTMEYVKFDLKKEQFVTEHDEVSGWHNVVFRNLPMAGSRLAGRLLYQHWA